MPNPLDDASAAHRADRKAGKIAAEHKTGPGRPEALEAHTQRDEGSEEPIGKLDAARRDNERPNLRARPHRPSLPPIRPGDSHQPSLPTRKQGRALRRQDQPRGSLTVERPRGALLSIRL